MKGMVLGYRLRSGCFFLWALSLLGTDRAAVAQAGYQLRADRLVVETAAHWQAWTLPTHAVEVTPTGTVAPHRFRSRYNLLEDRATFQRALKDFKRGAHPDGHSESGQHGNAGHSRQCPDAEEKRTDRASLYLSDAHGDQPGRLQPSGCRGDFGWGSDHVLGAVGIGSAGRLVGGGGLGSGGGSEIRWCCTLSRRRWAIPFRQFRLLVAPDQKPVMEEVAKVGFELVARTTEPNEDRRTFSFGVSQPAVVSGVDGSYGGDVAGGGDRQQAGAGSAGDGSRVGGPCQQQTKAKSCTSSSTKRALRSRWIVWCMRDCLWRVRGARSIIAASGLGWLILKWWGYGDNISIGMVEGGGNLALTGDGFSPVGAFDGDFSTSFPARGSREDGDCGSGGVDHRHGRDLLARRGADVLDLAQDLYRRL